MLATWRMCHGLRSKIVFTPNTRSSWGVVNRAVIAFEIKNTPGLETAALSSREQMPLTVITLLAVWIHFGFCLEEEGALGTLTRE